MGCYLCRTLCIWLRSWRCEGHSRHTQFECLPFWNLPVPPGSDSGLSVLPLSIRDPVQVISTAQSPVTFQFLLKVTIRMAGTWCIHSWKAMALTEYSQLPRSMEHRYCFVSEFSGNRNLCLNFLFPTLV